MRQTSDIKACVIGDRGVGKSTLINSLFDSRVVRIPNGAAKVRGTITTDAYTGLIQWQENEQGRQVGVHICDTPGMYISV